MPYTDPFIIRALLLFYFGFLVWPCTLCLWSSSSLWFFSLCWERTWPESSQLPLLALVFRWAEHQRAGCVEGILYPYFDGNHRFFLWQGIMYIVLFFYPALVAVGFLAMGMRGASGQFNLSLAISFPHPGTSSMAVIPWRVQRRRLPCGFTLRNWWITRAVLRTGFILVTWKQTTMPSHAWVSPPAQARTRPFQTWLFRRTCFFIWRETLGAVGAPCTVLYAIIRLKIRFHLKERVIGVTCFVVLLLYSFRYLANLIECKYHINYLYWPERSHIHTHFYACSSFPLTLSILGTEPVKQLSARDLLSCPNCTIYTKDSLEIKDINIFLLLRSSQGFSVWASVRSCNYSKTEKLCG